MTAGIIIIVTIFVLILFYVFGGDQKTQTTKNEEHKASSEALRQTRLAALKRQAELNSDYTTVDAINNNTYDGKLPWMTPDGKWENMYLKVMEVKIAGINYRRGIARLYDSSSRHEGFLMPEPKNPHDPNAIKILTDDGVHVGYIPAYQTAEVRAFVNNQFPAKVIISIDEEDSFYDEYNDKEKRQFSGKILILDPDGDEYV